MLFPQGVEVVFSTVDEEDNFFLFPKGVPSTLTKALMGTLSGCSGKVAKTCNKPTRSISFSPKPKMPPQQTLNPASRTWAKVSSRS
jgi:hypothetical protein